MGGWHDPAKTNGPRFALLSTALSLALEKPSAAITFCILLPFYLVLKQFQAHWRIFYPY